MFVISVDTPDYVFLVPLVSGEINLIEQID